MTTEWQRVTQIVWLAGFLEGEGCFRANAVLNVMAWLI